jgi:hypothetical protein
MAQEFNISIQDSQGTAVYPIAPEQFDFSRYHEYEASLLERNQKFWEGEQGILVYRRVRANGVFFDKCRDYKESLALQLGALQDSLSYEADIANFLEPWYGIGYIASCFGSEYVWNKGQSPSVVQRFKTVGDILNSDYTPLHQTKIGKHILEMEEYFLDKTKGKIPMSFCDVQSPLNMLSYLLPINDLFLEIYDDPEGVAKAADLMAELLIEFLGKQRELIGANLASPGHGFASSRVFNGIGMSDDNSIMLQAEDYLELFGKADEKVGREFGGLVYHSCGNWESKIRMVKSLEGIRMADAAFSLQTDPTPNDPDVFSEAFRGSGIVLNARAVGSSEECFPIFEKLIKPGQKLIAVTYCSNAEDQKRLYQSLHTLAI